MIEKIKLMILKKENILSLLSGIIFVIIFSWGYYHIDNNWYEYRDDGIITMSAAKNLVDFGFIGVSPSGPIVEASSSPMQLFIYAITYFITDVAYDTYSYWQTMIATFLLGFLFIRFFSDKPVLALIISTLSALGLTYFYPFFEWHGSGMENAITHILFLATIYILYQFIRDQHIKYWLAIIVFFATIARLDSVYHISLLLVIFSIYWFVTYKNLKALYLSLIVFVLWFLFHSWRYYYFGDFLPNTAYAQGISVTDKISMLIEIDESYINQSLGLAKELFMKQAGWLLLAVLPMLYFFKRTKANIFLLLLLLSIVLTSWFNPFLFGPTRIDHARTTTQMTLIVVLFVSSVIYFANEKKSIVFVVILSLPFTVLFYQFQNLKPYYLGWSTKGFENVRKNFMKIAKEHEILRPTISNPDLGIMTWHKQLNDIDLGMLGSPIMAKLNNSPMITEYYLRYGLPDLIEAHGYWVRKYCKSIFMKEKFNSLYSVVGKEINITNICSSKNKQPMIYWIRNDIKKDSNSLERKFLNDLQLNISVARIKQEIDTCNSDNRDCSYIARTTYKFIPELKNSNEFQKAFSLFSSATDKALLGGWKDAQAHEVIINTIQKKIYHVPKREPNMIANYDLYLENSKLIYVKSPCQKSDTHHKFYLHIFPKNRFDLPKNNKASFLNMDFWFNGLVKDGKCITIRKLPDFPIKGIGTGQYSIVYRKNNKRSFINHWKIYFEPD
jgi:hypothetical protein